jgi:streptogramin lyase
MTTSGTATVFPIPSGAGVTGLIARRDGTLSFTERWVTGGPTYLGRITTAGQISEISLELKN